MLSPEQLENAMGQWGRYFPVGEHDILRLADANVPMQFDERRMSIGDNVLARMRQDGSTCPIERAYSTAYPEQAADIERAVVALGAYSRGIAVMLRAAYCWHVGINLKLSVLGGIAHKLLPDAEYAVRDKKLKKAKFYGSVEIGRAAVWATLIQRKAA